MTARVCYVSAPDYNQAFGVQSRMQFELLLTVAVKSWGVIYMKENKEKQNGSPLNHKSINKGTLFAFSFTVFVNAGLFLFLYHRY